MKRSAAATSDITAFFVKLPRHSFATRSAQRKVEREKARLQKAQALMATPLLRALPLVLSSGFLYKAECRNAALASKSWKSIWVEAQHELPASCRVQINIQLCRKENDQWPMWVRMRGLQQVIPTQEFCRAIFDKLCELKVAAETTERKKQKVRDTLPKWGVDFLGIHMYVWGSSTYNGGGIYLSLWKRFCTCGTVNYPFYELGGWSIRLDHEMVLWTRGTFRKWKKIYDWQPLWDWKFVDLPLEEEEAEVEDVAPPRPPPCRGNIDFYFQPQAQDLD